MFHGMTLRVIFQPGQKWRERMGKGNITDGKRGRMDVLKFDNRSLRSLPVDPRLNGDDGDGGKSAEKPSPLLCFSWCEPTAVVEPRLVAASLDALALLGGTNREEVESRKFVEYMSGNQRIPGSRPACHNYSGNQFGQGAVARPGDAQTMYMGEIVNEDGQRWELGLKGAGKVESWGKGDGRRVLRDGIREFLSCEALYALGVPTARAVAITTSSTVAVRDVFAIGEPAEERCCVQALVAQTFLRFGSLQMLGSKSDESKSRDGVDALENLLVFIIDSYFPDIKVPPPVDGEGKEGRMREMCTKFLQQITLLTAQLVAKWQAAGFCHGLLNTDNMGITGQTIECGMSGFMEGFDPSWACNPSDDTGRYSYGAQPDVCRYNLAKLGEALEPLLPRPDVQEQLARFDAEYSKAHLSLFRRKLGLLTIVVAQEKLDAAEKRGDADEARDQRLIIDQMADAAMGDAKLVSDLLQIMSDSGADFALTFRNLWRVDSLSDQVCIERFLAWLLPNLPAPSQMAHRCRPLMPAAQLRTLVEMAGAPGGLGGTRFNMDMVMLEVRRAERRAEYSCMTAEEKSARDTSGWRSWLKRYWNRLVKEVVVHGGGGAGAGAGAGGTKEGKDIAAMAVRKVLTARSRSMQRCNPHTVLRKHMLQTAVEHAEAGDFAHVTRLHQLLRDPFTQDTVIQLSFHGGKSGGKTDVSLTWTAYKPLPVNETLSLVMPGFERPDGDQGELNLEGGHASRFSCTWDSMHCKLTLKVISNIEAGEAVSVTIAASLALPSDKGTLDEAREDEPPPPPAEPEWYSLTIAEDCKGIPPPWADCL